MGFTLCREVDLGPTSRADRKHSGQSANIDVNQQIKNIGRGQ
jgi:hypothetical protein